MFKCIKLKDSDLEFLAVRLEMNSSTKHANSDKIKKKIDNVITLTHCELVKISHKINDFIQN